MSIINKQNKMNNNIIYPNYKLNGLTIKLEKILSMVEKTKVIIREFGLINGTNQLEKLIESMQKPKVACKNCIGKCGKIALFALFLP